MLDFLEAYIHFALMYTTDGIFPVLPIKYMMIENSQTTMPSTVTTSTKPAVSYLCVIFCQCIE